MKKKEVEFAGRTYSCRVVKSNEGEELLIGSTGLLDALQPGSFDSENEGFASKEAEKLYDEFSSSPMPEVSSCRMTSWLRC